MEISLFDAGRQTLEKDEVDVPALIGSLIRRRPWSDKVRIEAEPVTKFTDRRRLERVVGNLVSNAIEYGRDDITVRVRQLGERSLIEVGDKGPGIPAEHIPHLFERFFKADPSRTVSGTGVGRSIVYENVPCSTAPSPRSDLGEGSTFSVTLPLTLEEAEPDDLDQAKPELDPRRRHAV
jgi:signal transduction histidine kinase